MKKIFEMRLIKEIEDVRIYSLGSKFLVKAPGLKDKSCLDFDSAFSYAVSLNE